MAHGAGGRACRQGAQRPLSGGRPRQATVSAARCLLMTISLLVGLASRRAGRGLGGACAHPLRGLGWWARWRVSRRPGLLPGPSGAGTPSRAGRGLPAGPGRARDGQHRAAGVGRAVALARLPHIRRRRPRRPAPMTSTSPSRRAIPASTLRGVPRSSAGSVAMPSGRPPKVASRVSHRRCQASSCRIWRSSGQGAGGCRAAARPARGSAGHRGGRAGQPGAARAHCPVTR